MPKADAVPPLEFPKMLYLKVSAGRTRSCVVDTAAQEAAAAVDGWAASQEDALGLPKESA